MNKHETRNQKHSPTNIVLLGTLLSLCVSIVLVLLLSLFILNDQIDPSVVRYAGYFTIVLSILPATLISGVRKERPIIISISTAAAYLLIMSCINIIFFEGKFRGVLDVIITIVITCTFAILLSTRRKKTMTRKKFKHR